MRGRFSCLKALLSVELTLTRWMCQENNVQKKTTYRNGMFTFAGQPADLLARACLERQTPPTIVRDGL
jgi:hypothetical protein